jgi:single-strand DNA-binding protein
MLTAFVTGNLGRDAELRDAGNEKVCSFNVASSRKIKNQDVTTWVRCSLWGRRGESLAQHLTKGKRVAVTGELSTKEKDGKTYLELRVSEIDFMGGGAGAGKSSGSSKPSGDSAPADDYDTGGAGDDPLPF